MKPLQLRPMTPQTTSLVSLRVPDMEGKGCVAARSSLPQTLSLDALPNCSIPLTLGNNGPVLWCF